MWGLLWVSATQYQVVCPRKIKFIHEYIQIYKQRIFEESLRFVFKHWHPAQGSCKYTHDISAKRRIVPQKSPVIAQRADTCTLNAQQRDVGGRGRDPQKPKESCTTIQKRHTHCFVVVPQKQKESCTRILYTKTKRILLTHKNKKNLVDPQKQKESCTTIQKRLTHKRQQQNISWPQKTDTRTLDAQQRDVGGRGRDPKKQKESCTTIQIRQQ